MAKLASGEEISNRLQDATTPSSIPGQLQNANHQEGASHDRLHPPALRSASCRLASASRPSPGTGRSTRRPAWVVLGTMLAGTVSLRLHPDPRVHASAPASSPRPPRDWNPDPEGQICGSRYTDHRPDDQLLMLWCSPRQTLKHFPAGQRSPPARRPVAHPGPACCWPSTCGFRLPARKVRADWVLTRMERFLAVSRP